MKRSQFLASLLGVVAAPFVAKEVLAKEEGKPVFDVERIQRRLDFLRKYPLSEKECWRPEEYMPFKNYGIMIPEGNGKFKLLKEGGEIEIVSLKEWENV